MRDMFVVLPVTAFLFAAVLYFVVGHNREGESLEIVPSDPVYEGLMERVSAFENQTKETK